MSQRCHIQTCASYSITSSADDCKVGGTAMPSSSIKGRFRRRTGSHFSGVVTNCVRLLTFNVAEPTYSLWTEDGPRPDNQENDHEQVEQRKSRTDGHRC